MTGLDTQRPVPAGAIVTAMEMVKLLGSEDEAGTSPDILEVLREGPKLWGRDLIVEAHSVIIYAAAKAVPHTEELGDALHSMLPAVLTRMHAMQLPKVPDSFLPTVAGIITSSFFGQTAAPR